MRSGYELRAQRPEEHPDQAERRHGLERHPAMAGDDPVQAKHRERRQHERGDHRQRRSGEHQVRAGAADRLAQRLDPDVAIAPVLGGVERPVEGREEAVVEHLHDDQQANRRPHHPGQQAPGGGGQDQGQGDHDHTLERELHERTGCEEAGLVGSDECTPDEQEREQRDHDGYGHADWSVPGVHSRIPLRNGRRLEAGRRPVAPQPPDVAPERLGKQGERGREADAGESDRAAHRLPRSRARRPGSPRPPCASRGRAAARASTRPATRRPGTRSVPGRSGAPTRRPRGRRRRPARGSGTRRPRRPSARPASTPSRCAARRIRRRSRAPAPRLRAPPAGRPALTRRTSPRPAPRRRRPASRARASPTRPGRSAPSDCGAGCGPARRPWPRRRRHRRATRRDRGRPSPRAPRAAAPGRPARSPGHPEPTEACLGTRTYERKVPWMG